MGSQTQLFSSEQTIRILHINFGTATWFWVVRRPAEWRIAQFILLYLLLTSFQNNFW